MICKSSYSIYLWTHRSSLIFRHTDTSIYIQWLKNFQLWLHLGSFDMTDFRSSICKITGYSGISIWAFSIHFKKTSFALQSSKMWLSIHSLKPNSSTQSLKDGWSMMPATECWCKHCNGLDDNWPLWSLITIHSRYSKHFGNNCIIFTKNMRLNAYVR